jgi:ABC-type multidrug transport system permease subunit
MESKSRNPSAVAQSHSPLTYRIMVQIAADWILDVSQTIDQEKLDEAGFFRDFSPVSATEPTDCVVPNATSSSAISVGSSHDRCNSHEHAQWSTEVYEHFFRDAINLKRDSYGLMLRVGTIVIGSGLIAIVFAGTTEQSLDSVVGLQSHIGVVVFLILAVLPAIDLFLIDFIDQHPVFVREFTTDHFRFISYGLAKVAMEAITTFLEVLVMFLLVYWSVGFLGRFWYWVLVLFLLAMVSGSLGLLIASVVRYPESARELVPMIILPQMLLCGFFVNVEFLPQWIQWTSWLMPLTYAFRLLLAEEFSTCLERTYEEQLKVNCAESFLTALGSDANVYNETSVLRLAQAGTYVGLKNIVEYLGFFSTGQDPLAGFWNSCRVSTRRRL